MTTPDTTEYGIGPATQIPRLVRMWKRLKANALTDRCSIRVFEGHLYSLMDDDDYYETSGNRKLINCLLHTWDGIRNFALKDELTQGWGSRLAERTDEEQQKIDDWVKDFEIDLTELKSRGRF